MNLLELTFFTPSLGFIGALGFGASLLLAGSAVSGIAGTYLSYRSQQQAADLAEQQAKINAEMQRREAEEDAQAENREMLRLREEQRRRRAAMESGYARSGVLLEGSPTEILTRQREADEYNVQARHYEGNERRKRMLWSAGNGLQMGKAQASSMRFGANTSFISGMGHTAARTYGNYKTWSS